MGVSRDCRNFSVPLLSQERVKLRTSNFVGTFLVGLSKKDPLQISGKVAVGVVRTLEIFMAPLYWAHRAVIFAIAQLSCR